MLLWIVLKLLFRCITVIESTIAFYLSLQLLKNVFMMLVVITYSKYHKLFAHYEIVPCWQWSFKSKEGRTDYIKTECALEK